MGSMGINGTMPGILGRVGARWASSLAVLAALGSAVAATSCGGGGGSGGGAKPMVLVEFLFVDRALQPSFPTGSRELPRNAQIIFQFSELVDPSTVDQQTIAIRSGASLASVPTGAFKVDGDRVIFDPTVTELGVANPFGFPANTQFNVDIPSVADASGYAGVATPVVRNLDNDPLLTSFFTNFTTSSSYLREIIPPQVLGITFVPDPDPQTGQIPGNGIMRITFSEAMDPATFVLATGATIAPGDTLDIRYTDESPNPNPNTDGFPAVPVQTGVFGKELKTIPGTFTFDATATVCTFIPSFSFGQSTYIFAVTLNQGLKDLAGNLLVNPRTFGKYQSDGHGRATGGTLQETFDTFVNEDATVTNADWGIATAGQLQGQPITTRRAFIMGFQLVEKTHAGSYFPIFDPLIGASANTDPRIPTPNPPTVDGRRVMWALADDEVGESGTIVNASWGPDSNATFAALFPEVILRIGYQKNASMSLASSFTGNYQGSPLVLYDGPYSIVQHANVGNELGDVVNGLLFANGDPRNAGPGKWPPPFDAWQGKTANVFGGGCTLQSAAQGDVDCLYIFTGFMDWPALSSFFDWEPDPNPAKPAQGDRVMVFDASVKEGDVYQQLRQWYGIKAPGVFQLLPGYPQRRLVSTFEGESPNPQPNFAGGIVNPEPSLTDTAFTIKKRVTVAQSLFWTPDISDPAGNGYLPPFSAANARTFGTKTDYLTPIVLPSLQPGGAAILVEYQGAMGIDPNAADRRTPDPLKALTAWTTNVNDCDTYPYLRFRVTLTSNLQSNTLARVTDILIPILQLP